MKKYLISFLVFFAASISAQNVQELFEKMPLPSLSCDEAFHSAELEWESMTLDNDSIFNRAKSWAPGGELKLFSNKIEKLTAYIDRASENNSFSLSAPAAISKEMMISIEQLSKTRANITKVWNTYRESVIHLNADFWVPNELDNGCDQIQTSIKNLNKVSVQLIEKLSLFKSAINNSLIEFQVQFDELNKIKNPMANNQILDEVSNLLNILHELSNTFNFHYKNMVETRMAWNNAFCK